MVLVVTAVEHLHILIGQETKTMSFHWLQVVYMSLSTRSLVGVQALVSEPGLHGPAYS